MQARKKKAAKGLELAAQAITEPRPTMERDNSATNDQDMDEREN